jgi:hypothetical protein
MLQVLINFTLDFIFVYITYFRLINDLIKTWSSSISIVKVDWDLLAMRKRDVIGNG